MHLSAYTEHTEGGGGAVPSRVAPESGQTACQGTPVPAWSTENWIIQIELSVPESGQMACLDTPVPAWSTEN